MAKVSVEEVRPFVEKLEAQDASTTARLLRRYAYCADRAKEAEVLKEALRTYMDGKGVTVLKGGRVTVKVTTVTYKAKPDYAGIGQALEQEDPALYKRLYQETPVKVTSRMGHTVEAPAN